MHSRSAPGGLVVSKRSSRCSSSTGRSCRASSGTPRVSPICAHVRANSLTMHCMEPAVMANEEAIEAWDGPLYDRFVHFRHLLVGGLGVHGDEGLRVVAPAPGERALDIGCGFGDTTRQLAELVGPDGSVLGVDAAPRFIETAREEAVGAGVRNARFAVVDVEAQTFDEQFDLAFSRMGTMFFANPVAALRNVRRALAPG